MKLFTKSITNVIAILRNFYLLYKHMYTHTHTHLQYIYNNVLFLSADIFANATGMKDVIAALYGTLLPAALKF